MIEVVVMEEIREERWMAKRGSIAGAFIPAERLASAHWQCMRSPVNNTTADSKTVHVSQNFQSLGLYSCRTASICPLAVHTDDEVSTPFQSTTWQLTRKPYTFPGIFNRWDFYSCRTASICPLAEHTDDKV